MDAVKQLRADAKPLVAGTDLRLGVTGAGGAGARLAGGVGERRGDRRHRDRAADPLLLILIFRSVILARDADPRDRPGLAGRGRPRSALANKIFDLKTDSSIQVILIVVLFGIGTDYILFFLFRYRERLREGEESRAAVAHAVERAGEAIASAGGAVIVVVHGAGAQLARHLQVDRPGAGHRRRRHRGRGADPGAGDRLAARHQGVLAVEVLAEGAQGAPGSRRVGRLAGTPPGAVRRRVRRLVLAVLAIFALGFNPNFDLGDSGAPKTVESVGRPARPCRRASRPVPPTRPRCCLHLHDGQPLDQAELTTYAADLGKAQGVGPGRARP